MEIGPPGRKGGWASMREGEWNAETQDLYLEDRAEFKSGLYPPRIQVKNISVPESSAALGSYGPFPG